MSRILRQTETEREGKERASSSKTVELAAAILAEVAATDEPLGVREVGRRLNMTKTMAHRLMVALDRSGLLAAEPVTQKYSLGPAVLTLASAFARRNDLLAIAVPHMQHLRELFDETVSLNVIVGDERLTLSQVESFNELRYTSRGGTRHPLHAGAAGHCLIAFSEAALRDELVARIPLRAYTTATLRDRSELQRKLEAVARKGYATTRGERVPGTVGIAAPIFGTRWGVAALSISGPDERLPPVMVRRIAPVLCSVAEEVTRELAAAESFLCLNDPTGTNRLAPGDHVGSDDARRRRQ